MLFVAVNTLPQIACPLMWLVLFTWPGRAVAGPAPPVAAPRGKVAAPPPPTLHFASSLPVAAPFRVPYQLVCTGSSSLCLAPSPSPPPLEIPRRRGPEKPPARNKIAREAARTPAQSSAVRQKNARVHVVDELDDDDAYWVRDDRDNTAGGDDRDGTDEDDRDDWGAWDAWDDMGDPDDRDRDGELVSWSMASRVSSESRSFPANTPSCFSPSGSTAAPPVRVRLTGGEGAVSAGS